MRVYNKIVINMATNEVLEEDSFEHQGQVAHCGRSGESATSATYVQAPGPSAQEIALQEQQLKVLQTQEKESEQMRPYVLKGMGLMEDEAGDLRYMTEEERTAGMSTLERGQYDITKMSQERQAKAYAGKLPISPALEEELSAQQSKMQQALSQRLGPNWMMTTPGQQAWTAFTQKADLVREEARRGAMSTEGGLLLSNLGYLGNTEGTKTSMAGQFPGRTSGLFGGYGVLQQPYQQQRASELQAGIQTSNVAMQNAQLRQEYSMDKRNKTYAVWSGQGALGNAQS